MKRVFIVGMANPHFKDMGTVTDKPYKTKVEALNRRSELHNMGVTRVFIKCKRV